jgi:chromosome segregation ATPase
MRMTLEGAMADKPVWRQLYDRVASEVGPRLTEVTASEEFAEATANAAAMRRRMMRDLEQRSRRWLHMWNLPAGSDINMLRREIGELERQVRDLSKRLEDLGESPGPESPKPRRARQPTRSAKPAGAAKAGKTARGR